MDDLEMANIIRPCFAKLEQHLDLCPILGQLYTNKLLNTHQMEKLRSMRDRRMDQNFEFLMYLLHQPVQQLRKLCDVLQNDFGNPAHQVLAAELLSAMIPPDPMEVVPGIADAIPMDF